MPTFEDDIAEGAITPYRESEIVFNLPTYALRSKPWRKTWRGPELLGSARHADDLAPAQNVIMLPNGTWMLESSQWRMAFDSTTGTLGDTTASPAEFWNLAPDHNRVTIGSSVLPDGTGTEYPHAWIVKDIPASSVGDWERELTADVAAYPKPGLPGRMNRVGQGKFTFPANQPFALRFITGERLGLLYEPFLTFYFGGPADVVEPAGAAGGEFALVFWTFGAYDLYQRTKPGQADPWVQMWRSWWALPVGAGGVHTFYIIPDGRHFVWVTTDAGESRGAAPGQNNRAIRIPTSKTGYTEKSVSAGPGIVRMDVREGSRIPWQLHYFTYVAASGASTREGAEGWIVGPSFHLPQQVPAGTKLWVDLDAELPTGTEIRARVLNVLTNFYLTPNADGSFPTTVNTTLYRVEFEFRIASGGDYAITPRLRGATVRMDGVVSPVQPVPFVGDRILGWQVNGPTVEPDAESALCDVDDPGSLLGSRGGGNGGLAVNADTHAVIRTKYDPDDATKTVTVFSGVLKKAPPEKYGRAGWSWPVANARIWRAMLAGQYSRLAQPGNTNWARRVFAVDPDAPANAVGQRPPMKISGICTDLVKAGGYDDSQIDFPDLDFRLFANPDRQKDYELNPGVRLVDALDYFTRIYLNRYLFWDGNAGDLLPDFDQPRGMWRFIRMPVYSADGSGYTVRYNFTSDGPASGTKQVHLPGSYPALTTFATRLSGPTVEPPEANYVLVYAGSQALLSDPEDFFQSLLHDPTQRTMVKRIYNPRALSIDVNNPTEDLDSPDWAGGEMRAFMHIDPTLNVDDGGPKTSAAVSFVCRRIFDAVGYGRQPLEWEAPCFFIEDPDDAQLQGRRRPLRAGDVVTFDGEYVVLTAANMQNPLSDLEQMYTLEGFYPARPVGYSL